MDNDARVALRYEFPITKENSPITTQARLIFERDILVWLGLGHKWKQRYGDDGSTLA
jgi:hypothetical protein